MTPDYDLDDNIVADRPDQLKAVIEPTRGVILDLILERAASVTELAAALDRPKSSVAHHIDVLVKAGLVKVVRTRKVRAMEERFYGRVARTVIMGTEALSEGVRGPDFLAEAAIEARHLKPGDYLGTLRHARISEDQAQAFFDRLGELAEEFTELTREGDTVFGFVAAVYPTEQPTLPPAKKPTS